MNLKSTFLHMKCVRREIYYHLQTTDKAYNFIEVFAVKDKLKQHLTNSCFKKHVAWRLMIPANKRSHFKAPHTKNNIF